MTVSFLNILTVYCDLKKNKQLCPPKSVLSSLNEYRRRVSQRQINLKDFYSDRHRTVSALNKNYGCNCESNGA